MDRVGKAFFVTFAIGFVFTCAPAQAGNFLSDVQFLGQLGSENYRWLDNNAASRIGDESGNHLVTSFSAANHFRRTPGIIYGMEVVASKGDGDYFGDPWSGIAVPPPQRITNAGTLSTFIRFGINGGYRLTKGPFGFNLLGNLGFEDWLRNIKNGVSTTNSPTDGHEDKINFRGGRLLVGLDYRLARLHLNVNAGPMYGSVSRSISFKTPPTDDSFTVDSKFTHAYFAEFSANLTLDEAGFHHLQLALYHENLKTKYNSDMYVSERGTAYYQPGAEITSNAVLFGYGYRF